MTNLTDEKILEFIHAGEGWFWDDDPNKTYQAAPSTLEFKRIFPFVARFKHGGCRDFKNFSLTKPKTYENGKWYAANYTRVIGTSKTTYKLCVKYRKQENDFEFGEIFYQESELTNIRRIPPEMWEEK